MRRSIRIKNITLIIIMILMVVITVFPSCSAEDTLPILVNIKIKEDEESRRITSTVIGKSSKASSMFYHPEYLGNGNHYPTVGSDEYLEYKEQDGILLSQGLWNIHCSWRDSTGEILSGSTGPIWINLNTEMIYVKYGTNSLELSYSVISDTIESPYLSLSIYPFIDGNISDSPLESYSDLAAGKDSDIILNSVKTGNKTIYSFADTSFNESGYYILVIKVKESETSNNVLFTDVIGFASRFGCSTVLKGSCEVETGNSGGGSIYLPDISDPTDPIRGQDGEVIEVTNKVTTSSDGTTQTKLNETEIQDNKIYVILPDENTESNPNMSLGHNSGDTSSTTRIEPPENAVFGINLNGTNVSLSVESKTPDKWWEIVGPYYDESSAIIELCSNSSMTLYNNNGGTSGIDAGWAYIDGTRRFDANTLLKGGTMNIVGSGASDNISNAKVVFLGATAQNNEGDNDHISSRWTKQGVINIYSGQVSDNNGKTYNSSGGNVILDGNVEVIGVTGISTWNTENQFSGNTYIYSSTINGTLSSAIKIIEGAKITAVGDNSSGVLNDTATGIYILGNGQGGSINILLDNGHINASGSSSSNEAGIRIENFKGTINITIKNHSNISSSNGYGLYFYKCSGKINIIKDNTSTVTGKNNSNAIYISNSTVNINGTNYTSSLAKI